jgi:hypothetical protein
MSRTPIPEDLIHQSSEVERSGKRFDYLCRLAEEVAFPIVQQSLFREYKETVATGAGILTEEAKQALETLAEDAAILEDLDEEKIIDDLQRGLGEALPPPDEEECRQHTRDFSQVLMSAWLETLRKAQSRAQKLELTESLLPRETLSVSNLLHRMVARSKLPESIADALSFFAPNEEEIVTVLTTLREKLFAQPRLVDLPFDLAMIGAPAITDESGRVMVMTHDLFISLLKEMENQQREERERQREERDRWLVAAMHANSFMDRDNDQWPVAASVGLPEFDSPMALRAAASVSVPLQPSRYRYFAAIKDSQLQTARIETAVRNARAATTE